MRTLISAANPRAGKTSLAYTLSKFLKFKYEKRGTVRGAEHLMPADGDITVIEGRETYKSGLAKGLSDLHEDVDRVIIIARHEENVLDEIALAVRNFNAPVAVIINCVRGEIESHDVLGTVPYDSTLGGISPEFIAKLVDGEVLVNADVVVDDILIGAMSPKCAIPWLKKKRDAALVTGGDRVDLQKLALEMGVRCLVLTGGIEPPKVIVKKAQECGAAIVLSNYDALTSVEKIQKEKTEPLTAEKAEKVAELFKKYVDFKRLMNFLELK